MEQVNLFWCLGSTRCHISKGLNINASSRARYPTAQDWRTNCPIRLGNKALTHYIAASYLVVVFLEPYCELTLQLFGWGHGMFLLGQIQMGESTMYLQMTLIGDVTKICLQ